MREIKFRAWDKEIKKMCQISNIDFAERQARAIRIYESGLGASWENFDVLELMQYTGLKDENGVEIYEGDVVKITDCKYGNKFRGEISFKNGSYVVESNIATHYRFIDYHIEVIGNIYENPELLETKKSS